MWYMHSALTQIRITHISYFIFERISHISYHISSSWRILNPHVRYSDIPTKSYQSKPSQTTLSYYFFFLQLHFHSRASSVFHILDLACRPGGGEIYVESQWNAQCKMSFLILHPMTMTRWQCDTHNLYFVTGNISRIINMHV